MLMEEKRGLFIVFEGIDASGKTTQLLTLARHIMGKSKYNHVCVTREPYKLREIRSILMHDKDPYKEAEKLAQLFVRDREEHVRELILPLTSKGIHVISDRYKISTLVYQSTQGIQMQKLIEMHKRMPVPDITFIIDTPADIAKERAGMEENRSEQKFEASVEFQNLLRKAYLKIPQVLRDERIFVIDGTKSKEEIGREIIRIYDMVIKA